MSSTAHDDELRLRLTTRLVEARARTDALFGLLAPDAIHDRPIPERHRIVFYRGHLEAFDWNLIAKSAFGIDSFNARFDDLFAFGIDPVDGGLPSDNPADWPPMVEIEAYIRLTRRAVDGFLREARFDASEDLLNGLVFQVAIEHRLMHRETLAYMYHWLPLERKIKPDRASSSFPIRGVSAESVEVPDGPATLGVVRNGTFGWDNEFDRNQVRVPRFRIDRHKVTNGRYLEFVREGGYRDRSLWKPADWEWKCRAGVECPSFWQPDGDAWMQRNMFDVRPLPASWPVYVSHAEAAAFARWTGKTLPSEQQLHRAAYGTPGGAERAYPWGDEPPTARRGNFDFGSWNPTPVGAFPAGNSAFGVSDLLGNGWEWTSTLFAPFEGFEKFNFYPGYSTDFFDGKHYVVKGGSAQTAACMLRRSFRNWFQPHYPRIYTGFRCVAA